MDVLLQAFAEMPDKHLVIAGTGTQFEEYKAIATDNVEFAGFLNRENLATVTHKAKAVIVPSQWYETFGMIIAEAYAEHTPVIVGDIGNIASLVDEGITGIKFKYDSSESLRDAVEEFENLDSAKMGEEAYNKYRREFAPDGNYQMLKAIYDSVKE
ncbi:MAG: glycosyltransferase [Lachnospiraceae bacterium]|nr:glycosyltransferase [Lachnospiraceae bacterium]